MSERAIFPDDVLRDLHDAVISAGLSRAGLVAQLDRRLVASFREASSPGGQIWADLSSLNNIAALADGSVPMKVWLETALHLAGPRAQSAVFRRALVAMGVTPASAGTSAATPLNRPPPAAGPPSVRRRLAIVALSVLAVVVAAIALKRRLVNGADTGMSAAGGGPTAGASAAPGPAIQRPGDPSSRAPADADMIAFGAGRVKIGTPAEDVQRELGRCQRELAIEPSDCSLDKLMRERPFEIDLRAFALDRYEVTNAQLVPWLDTEIAAGRARIEKSGVVFIGAEPIVTTGTALTGIIAVEGKLRVRDGFDRVPVVSVSWSGARRFCEQAHKRLPLEAEWEAAAADGRKVELPWGDDVPPCAAVAFLGVGQQRCTLKRARDVGASERDVTPHGVHDLGANVMEWVDGAGDVDGDAVIRGGSWSGSAFEARVARRRFAPAGSMNADVGFRCAR